MELRSEKLLEVAFFGLVYAGPTEEGMVQKGQNGMSVTVEILTL